MVFSELTLQAFFTLIFLLSFLFLSDYFKQKMVIGPGGQLIARIAREAGLDLMNAFMCEVRLKISATLKN